MHPFRQLSLIEQVAEHLRQGFRSGHWAGQLPGVRELVRELGVSKATMEAAVRLLEAGGDLKSSGPGRRKEIVISPGGRGGRRALRIGILLSTPLGQINLHAQDIILGMHRQIENAGHVCFFADRSMSEFRYKVPRIARMVESAQADAWVAYSAPADVLDWFVRHSIPVMAVGGRAIGKPVAGSTSDAEDAILDSVRTLGGLGHRRIVAISPDSWRIPFLSQTGTAFLAAMEKCGYPSGNYNLPAWEQTPEGLEKLLESLFRITPPTALIFVEPATCVAGLGFLGLKGIRIPQDVSIISMTTSPVFSLLPRRPAHFKWPIKEHIRRIDRWVKCLAKGGKDLDQVTFSATFDPGETLAAVKKVGRLKIESE